MTLRHAGRHIGGQLQAQRMFGADPGRQFNSAHEIFSFQVQAVFGYAAIYSYSNMSSIQPNGNAKLAPSTVGRQRHSVRLEPSSIGLRA